MNEFLTTGKIGRTHGVEGDLVFWSYSGETDHLRSLSEWTLTKNSKTVKLKVESFERKGKLFLVRFANYLTPETAQKWTGWEVTLSREQAPDLGAGEYYVADLLGCRLIHEGKECAQVVGWYDGPQAVLLEVKLEDGALRLVPFLNHYLGAVDVANKTIELVTPWILE